MQERAWRRIAPLAALTATVTIIAFAARLVPMVRGTGLDGLQGYDDGVYYVGSAALLAGRAPYADFTLLHPPFILLVLSPFALIGRLTSDHVGLASARVAFMALGAANAAMVTVLGARTRRPAVEWCLPAAAAGGLFYALWFSSIYATRTDLLEGIGTACLLVGLLLLWRRSSPAVPAYWVAGAMLGAGAATKIWGVVPMLVVAVWVWRTRGLPAAGRVLAGGALSSAVICGPFFVHAPAPMFRMVVRDQLGRSRNDVSRLARALDASSVKWNLPDLDPAQSVHVMTVVGLAVLGLAVVSWWCRTARLPVVLLAAGLLVLGLSPSYFTHYGELIAGPLALVVSGAVAAGVGRARSPAWRVVATVGPLLALLALEAPTSTHRFGTPDDLTAARAALPRHGCVATDRPSLLAALDVLTATLKRGCAVPVDLTGWVYDRDTEVEPDGGPMPRRLNQAFQRDLERYLASSDAAVLARPDRPLLGPDAMRQLRPMTSFDVGPVTVYVNRRP